MASSCSRFCFPRLFSKTKCVLSCFNSTTHHSLHRKVIYNHLTQYRRCSSINDGNSGNEDTYSKFEKMVRERRKQIQKSVLVHITSKYVMENLYNHCQSYGKVSRAFNYCLANNKEYAYVEFENIEGVQKLLANVKHDNRRDIIPVHSHCLVYLENKPGKFAVLPSEFIVNGSPTDDDILNVLLNAQSIPEQMSLLHQSLKLSELGQILRFFICNQLEMAFSGLFTKCTVLPFGSCVNGFGKSNCDLDMVLTMGEPILDSENSSKLLFHTKCALSTDRLQIQRHLDIISSIISNYFPGVTNMQRILQARVPIITFKHEWANTDCDLTMNNLSGVYMAELLYLFGEFDDRIHPLVFTVLKWAKENGLTQEAPGPWITNFSLILMVIVFLQSRPNPILPSLETLRKLSGKEHERSTEGMDCSFLRDVNKFPKSNNTEKLDELLWNFFHYYSNFDFKTRGLSINAALDVVKPEYCPLYIRNPFDAKLNVCRNVNTSELERIRERLKTALWKLESSCLPNSGNSWGLLDLVNANLNYQAKTFKLNSVGDLFDKHSTTGDHSQQVELWHNGGTMNVVADSTNSDSGNLPSRNRKSRNSTNKDMGKHLKLDRSLQNVFTTANIKGIAAEFFPNKKRKEKHGKGKSGSKPTFMF